MIRHRILVLDDYRDKISQTKNFLIIQDFLIFMHRQRDYKVHFFAIKIALEYLSRIPLV